MEVEIYSTPLGPLELAASDDGIVSVKFLFGRCGSENGNATELLEAPAGDTKKKNSATSHLDVCKNWLDAYFSGNILEMDDPPQKPKLVFPDKGTFFSTAWAALLETKVGDTVTYKELASRSGSPKAARAAGQAVKRHSLPILVPCHRVIPSSRYGRKRPRKEIQGETCCSESISLHGSRNMVGNYSGGDGSATKEWLLEHEQKMLKKASLAKN